MGKTCEKFQEREVFEKLFVRIESEPGTSLNTICTERVAVRKNHDFLVLLVWLPRTTAVACQSRPYGARCQWSEADIQQFGKERMSS